MRKIVLIAVLTLITLPFGMVRAQEDWTLLEKIREGQEKLALYTIPKPAKLPKAEDRIALAILDKETGEITLVNISLVGKTVQVLNQTGWRAAITRNNGVNSEFKIIEPANKLVVAMKYPVTLRKPGKNGEVRYLADVVYSAYSKDLELPEVIANGQAYVDNLISTSYQKLNALKVKSRAFPDKLITEALNQQMVESLLLIEHIGTAAIEGDLDSALRRLYTTFGLNTITTFDYSRSSAGARGLAQFMPATYAAVRAKRLELSLKAGFEDGMMDHENAVLAQIALMDLHLAALPKEVKARALDDPMKTGEYLAAGYNGGITRVNWTIEMWGDGWYLDHIRDIEAGRAEHRAIDSVIAGLKKKVAKAPTLAEAKKLKAELKAKEREHDALVAKIEKMKKRTLRLETRNYLKKLRPVYAHLDLRQKLALEQDRAFKEALAEAEIATSTPELPASESATSTLVFGSP